MKKQLFTLFLVTGMALGLSAQETVQEKDLPAGIQTSFKSQFAGASGAEWMMKDGTYKVHFKSNELKHMASFDKDGNLTSKGVEIKETELPGAISSAVSSSHNGRKIEEIYKIEKGGVTSYMVKLTGEPKTKLMYSADGQLVKDKSGN
ncbi:PepSY-like domain-containing protein [Flavihumibacter sp. UBA7668]|uniref:PepSY-like domain-containing protein n=1 Tax=Flavihumibacter sp. UBA7668 TaxID=1946542 RepID=UPI0025BDB524|nr:PepSY-like domain-containing protein [Flavihumibacter sp. UBA7668]